MKAQISVYLLKSSVTAEADALKLDSATMRSHVFAAGDSRGLLFVNPSTGNVPGWRRLLGGDIQPPADDVTESSSAVLVISAAGRRFALAFGHGWTMLDPEVYERRFGLKVALNALDPEQLRGAQARKFGGVAQQTSRQLARLSGVDAFELDWQRDLVTSLDGITVADAVGSRMTGRDAVRLAVELGAADLASICADLLKLSQGLGYQKAYPLIDNVQEVTDPAEIRTVTGTLATQLGRRDFSGVDLYPPELLPDSVVRFEVRHPRRKPWGVPEPGIPLLSVPLGAMQSAAAAERALRHSRLSGLDADGNEAGVWTFWDCLTCELTVAGERYIKNGATWFKIKVSFLQEVDAFIRGLRSSGLAYPAWNLRDDEGVYNANAAQQKGWALMDRKTIALPDRSPIEACDLVTEHGHIIHVKKRKYGSGPLSHAIGQAAVGADLLKNVQEFRNELRQRLAAARPGFEKLIRDEPGAVTKLPIVLALITTGSSGSSIGEGLPFFTKVFLMRNVMVLRNIGYTVYLDEIGGANPLDGVTRRTRRRGKTLPAPAPSRQPR